MSGRAASGLSKPRATAKTGDIGLGLVIARGIARAHQGDIRMYTRPEAGMRVALSLPKAA